MTVAYLGPKGSFSEKAVLKLFSEKDILPVSSIKNAVEGVEKGKYDKALIPLENFYNGMVMPSIDALVDSKNVKINDEVELNIVHCFGALKIRGEIKRIYSHPQALEQCAKYISKNYPKAEIISLESTSKAAEKIKKEHIINGAAIASKSALEIYELEVLDEDVLPNNNTRFVLISKSDPVKGDKNKTLISIHPKMDKSGMLHDLLGFISKEKINIRHIHSRPDGKGKYYFVLEVDGFYSDKNLENAFDKINKYLEDEDSLKIIGSYPDREETK